MIWFVFRIIWLRYQPFVVYGLSIMWVVVDDMKLQGVLWSCLGLYMYIYIYIYVCVCVRLTGTVELYEVI